ncbi:nitroreductase/quinone reductase family protein [Pseudonocardia sp. MH-G8]|uniref:nitroreductase/quinone reductase family protein n=1 Tax=Pseudonocardia sp. MH-G8 TaxID=1854588 RepID=UPI000BA15391|nr:nitroreductase/quinone reductase family protein [Pseudonocardia sp. MH-G8]OZM78315.1 nitroreductase [Pseudonocardia sp. MH-G8]
MPGPQVTRRLLPLQNKLLNPLVAGLIARGLEPPTYAVLETVGRRTGRARRVPVANGLDGDTFWLIAALGERAAFVRNLRAHPRVRIKARPARLRDGLRSRWRTGTAHPLPGDDAAARHHALGRGRPGYRLDGVLLRALAEGEMLTVRIDLDPAGAKGDTTTT